MRTRLVFLPVLLLASLHATIAVAEDARLLRQPSIGETLIAFVHANDIWIAPRGGGESRRLTTFPGAETDPFLSPDGRTVAFSGQYDGNTDVYVVAVDGGSPRRLTWHPGTDTVEGWTPDGGRVLFSSGRENVPRGQPQLWTISTDGGMPSRLPLPRALRGSLSGDSRRIAYQVVDPWEDEFRNYRGGQAQPIRILDLSSLEMTKLPWDGSNDIAPIWLGDRIFFLSDRDFANNVWEYDTQTKELQQRTFFKEFDSKNLGGGAGALIFENGGDLYTLEAAGGEAQKLSIQLRGDFPWARPHWESVGSSIVSSALSATGQRAVFEARGEIFTVPAEKGDVRNLTRSSGAADRAPSWSPDGKWIARFSDGSGEYQLVLSDQFGGNERTIQLKNPNFYYTPAWSPDSKHLAFTDADRVLWCVEIESGKARRIDSEGFAHPERVIYPAWSPDSKWIAYSRRLRNQFDAIFVHSLESGRSTQISDGLSDVRTPAWARDGKYLYFLASTDYGINVGWLDMSSYNQPLNYSVYVAVLSSEEASPLAPESDDESMEAEEKADKDDEKDEDDEQEINVVIDFENLDQRILALDLPPRPYGDLGVADGGTLLYTEAIPNEEGLTLHRYKPEDRESEVVLEGIESYTLSGDGKKMLYSKAGGGYAIVDATAKPSPGDGQLDLSAMRMKVDPPAEWQQIFREAWRYQRDFFYVKNVHGLDLDWAYGAYGSLIKHVRHRADLNYVLDILGGETSVGHSFTYGGDMPDVETVPVGLLGADFSEENGRFRITRLYSGENWNPELRAPLSGPGIDATVGNYLLAVDGRELRSGDNLFAAFDRTAERQTVLTLNDRPKDDGSREITVVPVADDNALRRRDWVEGNRRRVDELSGGKLAYVWVPDTGSGGYTYFTRYYFAQQDKKGAVIDERFNHGGSIADYIVDLLSRELLGYFNNAAGEQPWTAPNAAIFGPKVMIINEMAGSGGDMLPYMFRKMEIGPLVGTRTWGGLVGRWDVPDLVDGGHVTAPRGGFYNTDGEWEVENEGVAPDYEVEQLPKLMAAGHDPQLEAAVRIALEKLKTEEVELLPQPKDPVRVKRPD